MRFASLTVCACVYIRDIVNFTALLLLFSSTLAFYFFIYRCWQLFFSHTHTQFTWVGKHMFVFVRCTYSCLRHASHSHKHVRIHRHARTPTHIDIFAAQLITIYSCRCCWVHEWRQWRTKYLHSSVPSRLHCTASARTKCLVFCFDVVGQTCLFAQNKI